MKRAIFPGSFDPFTIGHQDIVTRGLNIFDEIIISVGQNPDKHYMFSLEQRLKDIKDIFNQESRVRVLPYNCLTVDFAKTMNAQYILRGVRNTIDFEYERNLADINKHLANIETVILIASQQYGMISSSMVRELYTYNQDISQYLPIKQ